MTILQVAANSFIIATLLGLFSLIFIFREGEDWQSSQLCLLWRIILLLKILRLIWSVWQSNIVLHILVPCIICIKGIYTACIKTSVWIWTAWIRRERPVSTAVSLMSALQTHLIEEVWRLKRLSVISTKAFWSLLSTDFFWSVIFLKTAEKEAV